MKHHLLIILLLLSLTSPAQQLQVMSFNIRLNTAADSMNAWPYRKDMVASQILFHDVHLLGVQEALPEQVKDLQERLKGFRYTGVGRDDGKEKGEFVAMFFDTSRLSMEQTGHFWLSETPSVPGSKSWDAAITRMVTWARFRDKRAGKQFFAFNTHFDHIGKQARKESARLIRDTIRQMAGAHPVILMGDLNAPPSDDPLLILSEKNGDHTLYDTRMLSKETPYGPAGTFNAFKSAEIADQPIDYIFVNRDFIVFKHATLSQTWKGRFASDHFAVLAVIGWKKPAKK